MSKETDEFPFEAGKHNAFSHSPDCDSYFGKMTDVPGGEPHYKCACWCHTIDLDKDAPPDYVLDADEVTQCQMQHSRS